MKDMTPEFKKNCTGIFVVGGGCSEVNEALVERCAKDLGLRENLNWGYSAGRAIFYLHNNMLDKTGDVQKWLSLNIQLSGMVI